MKLNGRWLIVYTIALIAFIQGAYGIQITASGGGNGESGSVAMNFDTLKSTAVSSQIAINGADVTPYTAVIGPIAEFKQTHWVKDTSGKSASVYVKVLNAPSGLTYTSKVLPKEGNVATRSQVSAEQWLTVPKADSIKCTATASYGTTRSASVGLEEYKGTVAGDYVTLTGYYGKAVTTGTSVLASQTATIGAANSITISGSAKDSSGTYTVDTPIKGILGGKATFRRLSETASAGTTTLVAQWEHVHGTFTSTASYTPLVGTAQTKTRSSNYGTEYDINMRAAKGSLPTGNLGYYVKPGTTASKIQGAVNAAQSKDTINVAAGTYKENVKIDKSLTVKGAGSTKTIVDGNKAGSVFAIGKLNRNIDVALSSMTIQGGTGTIIGGNKYNKYGGGILNYGRLTVTGSTISGNVIPVNVFPETPNEWRLYWPGFGGGIYNEGTLAVTGSTISKNEVNGGAGSGIYNSGTATVTSSTISENAAPSFTSPSDTNQKYFYSSGYGSGIYNKGTLVVTGSTISKNTATFGGGIFNGGMLEVRGATIISGNKAKCSGGGIANAGKAKVTGSTISGNSASDGGGIYNSEKSTLEVTSSIVSGNTAQYNGGGIYHSGSTLEVTGSTITKNIAGLVGGVSRGGGIYYHGYFDDPGTLTVTDSTISKNTADYGGGISNMGATLVTLGGTTVISENTAKKDGGGIFCFGGNLVIGGASQIINNQASSGGGGGIYFLSSSDISVTFDGTKVGVKFNKAHEPDYVSQWYRGWGVYSPIPTLKNGFNPATQVTGNTHI